MKKERGTEEKMKKEKEKKGIQLPEKQPYALYREISLKRNYRLIGSMQCINDYCTILKRIRNE